MSQAGEIDVVGNNPDIPVVFNANSGSAVPIANTLELLGTVVVAGVNPFRSVGSGNTITYQAQIAQAIPASNASNIGLSAFDSAFFTVDPNGFVSLIGGSVSEAFNVDASTAPGTDPVVPTAGGIVTITGAQVAAGVVGTNVVRTNSLAANTYTIEIQRSTTAASSTLANNGVSHYNSTNFTVDANGFVGLLSTALGVLSVSGTANRITSTGGQNPVIDISASYVGQSSITTVGTITTGVWNGTAVDATHGGTNQTTYATGDILYASGANTLSKLPIGSANQVLTVIAGVPSWQSDGGGTVTSVSGTTNRITSTGGSTPVIDIAATYVGQTSITTLGTVATGVWNGTAIGPTFGGTGQTTYATGDILYASAPNVLSKLAAGSNTNVLTLAGGVPTWAAPTTGTVTSVSGTTNRITSTGGSTPVIDISASYVGQSSITTLGTITTGVWNGTVVSLAFGGTNANLTASDGGIFYSTSTAGAILAGVATAGKILQSGATAAPTWSTATFPGASPSNGQLLIGNGTNWVAASLTQPAAGLTITGGSGSITFALANDLLALENLATTGVAVRTGTSTWTTRTITGTANQVTVTNGDGVSGNPTLTLPSAIITPGTINNTSGTTTGIASGAAGSIFSYSNGQTYYVQCQAPGSNPIVRAAALVVSESALFQVTNFVAVNCSITISGSTVQISNVAGGTLAFDWSALRVF